MPESGETHADPPFWMPRRRGAADGLSAHNWIICASPRPCGPAQVTLAEQWTHDLAAFGSRHCRSLPDTCPKHLLAPQSSWSEVIDHPHGREKPAVQPSGSLLIRDVEVQAVA